MSELEVPAAPAPVEDTPATETPATAPAPVPAVGASAEVQSPKAEVISVPVDPVRSAAGRLGAKRRQQLIELGRQCELDHNLKAGRQRIRQLVQLGKRYEQEHGLRVAKPRRKPRGDAWADFLTALARVVKPAYRPAVEVLVAALTERGQGMSAA